MINDIKNSISYRKTFFEQVFVNVFSFQMNINYLATSLLPHTLYNRVAYCIDIKNIFFKYSS